MNAVESVTLAHIRFLSHTAEKAINKDRKPDEPTTFDGLMGLVNGIEGGEGQALAKGLPFYLGETPLTPYLLIAATTEAGKLAEYIKRPDGPELKQALEEASSNCLTMDVPTLVELALDFFGRFSPWQSSTLGYLERAGLLKKRESKEN